MNALSVLSEEHNKVLNEIYFNTNEDRTDDNTPISLLDFINPVCVRLNENKHKNKVAEEGPQSPSSYLFH